MSTVATLTEFFANRPTAEVAAIGRELAGEWLEANPARMGHLYLDPHRLYTWLNFAGGIILGAFGAGRDPYPDLDHLCRNTEEAYRESRAFFAA